MLDSSANIKMNSNNAGLLRALHEMCRHWKPGYLRNACRICPEICQRKCLCSVISIKYPSCHQCCICMVVVRAALLQNKTALELGWCCIVANITFLYIMNLTEQIIRTEGYIWTFYVYMCQNTFWASFLSRVPQQLKMSSAKVHEICAVVLNEISRRPTHF